MKISSVLLAAVALLASVAAVPAAAQDARTVAIVHARLAAEGITQLQEQNAKLGRIWAQVEAGNRGLLKAHQQGSAVGLVRDQEEELQQLEAQLIMRIMEVQRVRREVLANRAVVEAAGGSTRSRSEQQGPLTGTWSLTVQPGLKGTAYLVQHGTLVSGTYELSGGWAGSLRGTVVANKIRLERIDSQLGFVSILYGEVNLRGDVQMIQGRWEATQLATGMPSAGGWSAERQD